MAEPRIPIYIVRADRDSGEWDGSPEPTGRATPFAAWCAKRDTSRTHYDTYESDDGETRALMVRYVKS